MSGLIEIVFVAALALPLVLILYGLAEPLPNGPPNTRPQTLYWIVGVVGAYQIPQLLGGLGPFFVVTLLMISSLVLLYKMNRILFLTLSLGFLVDLGIIVARLPALFQTAVPWAGIVIRLSVWVLLAVYARRLKKKGYGF